MLRTRSILLPFASVFISLLPCLPARSADMPPYPAVCVLNYDWKGDLIAQGDGFFLNQNREIITATSLLEGGTLTEVRSQDGTLHAVSRVCAVDAYGGLSRVALDTAPESFTPLTVSAGLPAAGETVMLFRPGSTVEPFRVKEVRAFPGIEEFALIGFSEPVAGAPGSPILNIAGKVVGVTVLAMEGDPTRILATSPASIRVLAEASPGGIPYQEWVDSGEEAWRSSFIGTVLTGVVYASLGDNGRARPALEAAARYGAGTYEEVYARLGDLEAIEERYEKAQGLYQRAILLNPNRLDLYERLVFAQLSLGLGDEAETSARTAATVIPKDSGAKVLLSRVLNNRGRFEEAFQVALASARAASADARLWNQAAVSCMGMGRFEEAVDYGMKATSRDKDDSEAFSNLGYACLRSGQALRAILAFRRATELAPDEGDFIKALGEAYSSSGLRARAISAYRMAICVDPSDWQAYWRLADECLSNREYGQAATVCEQAVSRCPDNGWLRYKLGKALCRSGDVSGVTDQIQILDGINAELARQLRLLLDRSEIASEGWVVF